MSNLTKKIIYTLIALSLSYPAIADEASHRAAAIDMMKASGIEKNLNDATTKMVLSYMSQCTAPADAASKLTQYFEENENAIREGSINTYMKIFNESELKEIANANRNGDTKFFESATGKKLIENGQLLDIEATKLAGEVVKKRNPILEKIIEECKK